MPLDVLGRSDGATWRPLPGDHAADFRRLTPGVISRGRFSTPRHVGRHNFFFAALHAGFENLPPKLAALYADEEAYRAALLVRAGHAERETLDLASLDRATLKEVTAALIHRLLGLKGRVFMKEAGGQLIVERPASIAHAVLDEEGFRPVMKRVLDLIAEDVGVPLERLVDRAQRGAA
jgi:hypothetical protein